MRTTKKNKFRTIREFVETLESRQLLSASPNVIVSPNITVTPNANSGTVSGYTPAQIKQAYGISSISLNGLTGDGTGQTIAVVDAFSDPNILADLKTFDKTFSLSDPNFTQVSQSGSTTALPAADAGWAQEISLDVEWAHAIAPKANIILVDANSDNVSDLMKAVNYARNISSVSVVSMSWGSSEFASEKSYDKYFTTPANHIGVTFVAASGDEGAAGGAEYPASSPNVLAVGGTTLTINSYGTSSESAWSSSSGGTSRYESAPAYQSGVSTTGRTTPDVSYDANPNTGFAVYDSLAYQGQSGWATVGGTSAGAPQWAGLIAIADQGRVANGGTTLDGATGTLPAIYSYYANSSTYSTNFNDITSGSSSLGGYGFGHRFGGRFGGYGGSVSATTGYDTLTGIGTPKAASLVAALSKVTTATTSTVTVAAASKTNTRIMRAKAAAVTAAVTNTSYVNTARSATAFVANPVDSTIALEAITTLHATPLATISSGLVAGSVNRGTLVALSGFMVVGETQAAVTNAGWSRMTQVVSEGAKSISGLATKAVGEMAQIGAPMIAVPSEVAALDATTFRNSLSDAIDSFAHELAVVPSPSAAIGTAGNSRGLVKLVTGAVVAADAVLLGYYFANRSKRKPTFSETVVSDADQDK